MYVYMYTYVYVYVYIYIYIYSVSWHAVTCHVMPARAMWSSAIRHGIVRRASGCLNGSLAHGELLV